MTNTGSSSSSCKNSASRRLAPEAGDDGDGGDGEGGGGGGGEGGGNEGGGGAGGCDGGCDGGIKGGGGGATASGTDTPTLMATGAAETTVMPRLVERADTGWATNALATSATAVLLPKPASGMVRVAATLTLAAETRTPSMQFGS